METAAVKYSPRSSSRIQLGPSGFRDVSGRQQQQDWNEAVLRDRSQQEEERQLERRRRLAEQDALRRALDSQVAVKRGLATMASTTVKSIASVAQAAEVKDGCEVDARDREMEQLKDDLALTARLLQAEFRRALTPRLTAPVAPLSSIPQPWSSTSTSAAHPPQVDRAEAICRSDNSPRHLRSTERIRTSHGDTRSDGELRFDGYKAYARAKELSVQRQQKAVAVAPAPPPPRGLHGNAILPPALTCVQTSRAAKCEAMRAGLVEQMALNKQCAVPPPPVLPMYDPQALFGRLTLPQTPQARAAEQEAYRSVLDAQILLQRVKRDETGFLPIVLIKPNRPLN
jgi:hypothetical protein